MKALARISTRIPEGIDAAEVAKAAEQDAARFRPFLSELKLVIRRAEPRMGEKAVRWGQGSMHLCPFSMIHHSRRLSHNTLNWRKLKW